MLQKRNVEIFTAGCRVCEETVKIVNNAVCEDCNVRIYNLNDPCKSEECLKKTESYGIKRLPTVVVDGRVAECCISFPPNIDQLKALGVGKKLTS